MDIPRALLGHSLEALFVRTLLLTGLMVTVVGGGTAWHLLGRTEQVLQEEAVRDARMHVEPQLLNAMTPESVAEPLTGTAYGRVDARVRDTLLGPDTVRVKVWNPRGTVVYSSLPAQVGETDPSNEGVRRALRGEVSWEVTDVSESRFELGEGTLLEIYMPLAWAPGQRPAAVGEVYQRYEPYARAVRSLRGSVLVAGLVIFLTLPLGVYVIYRAGWHGIVVERDVAAQRLREVEGLNALLQRDVAYALDLRDDIRSLQRDTTFSPATPAEFATHYAFLSRHISELVDRAEAFFEGRGPAGRPAE